MHGLVNFDKCLNLFQQKHKFDIKAQAMRMFIYVSLNQPCKLRPIEIKFVLSQTVVKRNLDLLMSLGLIQREPDPDYLKRYLYSLTNEGEALVREINSLCS